jgi:hypothetical protein
MQFLPPGVAEHAVLIIGYIDEAPMMALVVNDPFPYQTAGQMPSYPQFGGRQTMPGQFQVPYGAMVGPIAWKNSIFNLQPVGNSGAGKDAITKPPDEGETSEKAESMTCTIDSTSIPWNPPGTVRVRVDGKNVGSFEFGPGGSTSLDFDCAAGHHQFQFSVSGVLPSSCSGSFDVDKDNTDFSPRIRVSPSGAVTCSLH